MQKFCLFASLLHLSNICETCQSNYSTSHMALIPVCTSTGSHHRLWNSLAVYLGETIGVQPPGFSPPRLGDWHWILEAAVGFCPVCRTYEITTRFWVVVICPIIKCLTVLEFYFILFDLCLFITIFNFILNYVLIVTFWIFTYNKIWILLIICCFIWNY